MNGVFQLFAKSISCQRLRGRKGVGRRMKRTQHFRLVNLVDVILCFVIARTHALCHSSMLTSIHSTRGPEVTIKNIMSFKLY